MAETLSSTGSTSDKLIQAALTIAARLQTDGLTSRSLAHEARVSASAVNYTFGSLQALLDEAVVHADGALSAFWTQQRKELGDGAIPAPDMAPILYLTTRRMVIQHPGAHALFWKDTLEAARLGGAAAFSASLADERTFWSGLLAQSGGQHLHPAPLQAFSLALRFAYQIFDAPEDFDSWAIALVNQFCHRLAGGRPGHEIDSVFRQKAERDAQLSDLPPASQHETAQLIIRTTVQTIMESGTDSATFREIARRANLSVSSVQHFFGSRRAYLAASFQAIYQGARDRVLFDAPRPNSLSVDELSQYLIRDRPTSPVMPHGDFAAIQALILSAARDGETRALAAGLVARTGQTSAQLLQALKTPRGAIGRLDAQILSLTLTHLVTLEVAGQISTQSIEDFGSLVRNLLEALFREPQSG